MLITSVYIVIMCFFVFTQCQSNENVVSIQILKSNPNVTECIISKTTYSFKKGDNFTLLITSEYFIEEALWIPPQNATPAKLDSLQDVEFRAIHKEGFNKPASEFFITHTQKARKTFKGLWKFSFKILNGVPSCHSGSHRSLRYLSKCNTTVNIVSNNRSHNNDVPQTLLKGRGRKDSVKWELIAVPVIAVVLLAQTVYIVCMKYRGLPMKFQRKKDSAVNIAERPPLPLPADAIVKEESTPVDVPEPSRHRYLDRTEVQPVKPKNMVHPYQKAHIPPSIPAQVQNSYNNNMSPILEKNRQAYRNHGFDSTEEIHPHDFVRRHLEARPSAPKLINRHSRSFREPPSAPIHLSPHPSHRVSRSFKEPKPAPRSSPNLPHKLFQLPQEPIMSPKPKKKSPIYPPPPLPDRRRSSDDEWQYEELQPATKYINENRFL